MIQLIKRQLKIDWWGHHGVRHWARVRRNGRIIAQHVPGVNTAVTDLFAVLHDAGRIDEHDDPEHGWRCAARLRRLHTSGDFGLSTSQYIELLFAIERHSEQIKPISPTVAGTVRKNANLSDSSTVRGATFLPVDRTRISFLRPVRNRNPSGSR